MTGRIERDRWSHRGAGWIQFPALLQLRLVVCVLYLALTTPVIPLRAQTTVAGEMAGARQPQTVGAEGLKSDHPFPGDEIPDVSTRTLLPEDIDKLPSTLHLWTLVGHTQVSVTAERFDVSGMHSDAAMTFGLRGGSWSQNKVLWNGFNVSSGDGAATWMVPDLSTAATLTYDSGSSKLFPSGAVLSLEPRKGASEVHGQAHIFFQSGAFQGVNVTPRLRSFGITESDERYRYFAQGNVQLGGPLASGWTYYGALSRLQIDKRIRNFSFPVRSTLTSETLHFSGDVSVRDQIGVVWLGQQRHQPTRGASPQVAFEATRNTAQPFQSAQASWTRTISPRSVLDTRVAVSVGRTDEALQAGVHQPGREELFPGSVDVPFVPSAEAGREIVAQLNRVQSGAPPSVTARSDGRLQLKTQIHTLRNGPGLSVHRLSFQFNLERLHTREQVRAFENLNLRFFRGLPDSVQVFNQSDVGNRSTRAYGNASDNVSVGDFTFSLAVQADWQSGSNHDSAGFRAHTLGWGSVGGHAGVGYRIGDVYATLLRASLAHSHLESLSRALEAVHPNGLSVSTYLWHDANPDGVFEPPERGRLTKREGSPFTRLDAELKQPYAREVRFEAVQRLPLGLTLSLHAFRRVDHDLLALINTGVLPGDFAAVEVFDPGNDGASQTGDEGLRTAYNQDPATLGQDAYLLTNPPEATAFSEGYEARVTRGGIRLRWELAFTRYRSVAWTAPGNGPAENDWGRLPVVNDPNQSILARGSTFFDRGLGARFWGTWQPGWDMRLSWVFSYLDGAPYGRILPVTGLNQGLVGILATRRGPGDGSAGDGKRTAFNLTADLRLSRVFGLGNGHLDAMLDVFNLTNLAHALEESDVTSPTHLWRIPLRFQTPRSLQLGLRFRW